MRFSRGKRGRNTWWYNHGPSAWIRKVRYKIFGRTMHATTARPSYYDVAGRSTNSYLTVLNNSLSQKRSRFLSNKNASVEILYRNKKSLTLPNPSIKDLQLIDGLTASEIKKKYIVTGSNNEILDELVKEYKKGNLSMSGISKYSKYREKELDQENLDKIIKRYKKVRQKSIANLYQIKYSSKNELKRKFSLHGSKGRLFNDMLDDFRSGKISMTKLTHSRTEPKKLNKQQMDEMLKAYEDSKRSRKIYFPSKLLSIKSFYDDIVESVKEKNSKSFLKNKYSYINQP